MYEEENKIQILGFLLTVMVFEILNSTIYFPGLEGK